MNAASSLSNGSNQQQRSECTRGWRSQAESNAVKVVSRGLDARSSVVRSVFICSVVALCCFGLVAWPASVSAEQLISLRNGMVLRGLYLEVASMNQNAFSAGNEGGIQNRPIWVVDDGLRRTYVHRRGMVAAEPRDVPDLHERIQFFQPVPDGGDQVASIGQTLGVTPFNQFGRRRMTIRGPNGAPFPVLQGITELTAKYAKVEALKTDDSIKLDMRIATSSISSDQLRDIFRRSTDPKDVDERLNVVRFFAESERYADARRELVRILDEFPESADLKPIVAQYVENEASQLLDQAALRRESGQYELAREILDRFPTSVVSRVTRVKVSDLVASMDETQQQIETVKQQLSELIGGLREPEQNALDAIVSEIQTELTPATLPRLSDFIRMGGNSTIDPETRVSLAIAGWLLGNGSGETNLKIVLSLIEVRSLVREYLVEEDPGKREEILQRLSSLEGARADYVAKMLPLMKPPRINALATDEMIQPDPVVAGMFHVGLDQASFHQFQAEDPSAIPPASYVVQLPPEYDPNRVYPCVVALHAAGAPAETQLNWWSGVPQESFLQGARDENGDGPADEEPTSMMRLGHSIRHGFIVVAPRWTRGGQPDYEYTMREHDAVLSSFRHAMRHFAIDADRVFIGGHGAGGTAAWDIAVSHPDLWSGMISISSRPDKTLQHYNANSKYVPVYIVKGDKDGVPLRDFGAIYDRYMTYDHDAMIVLYRGRGLDFFSEEADRIFEWMKTPNHRRPPPPEDLEVGSMRDGDRFFWWLEWQEMLPGLAINPILWDEAERLKAAPVRARVMANNEVLISQAPSDSFTVWLTPQMPLDFKEPIAVRYRSRRKDFNFDQSVGVMLEDVRVRADRARPFWGKVQIP
ncbi:alpha/beta hydrolase [Rhodopirellula halodulae]|uniref:alpha/beta hydrolase n=1 Tax=Rhodopirellula halodulae TaxID=2894198 RepID=UPI001E2DE83D|nr:alpha/beta hydrolase [Rhodopirellula sp. JC740]